MSRYPEEVVRHVESKLVRESGHFFWAGSRGRFRLNGTSYRARDILWGSAVGHGNMLAATCGEAACINPKHLEQRTMHHHMKAIGAKPWPGRRQRYTQCETCKKKMRPHGTRVADYPGTVPPGRGPLCQSCARRAKASDSAYVDMKFNSTTAQALWDTLIPYGVAFDFDHDVVRRTVPVDLWSAFGVDADPN